MRYVYNIRYLCAVTADSQEEAEAILAKEELFGQIDSPLERYELWETDDESADTVPPGS